MLGPAVALLPTAHRSIYMTDRCANAVMAEWSDLPASPRIDAGAG